jgi:hypothetical protein
MESNERLMLRLPSDLKAMFSTLCESEGVTVSSKIKAMMINELNQKLISVKLQTIPKSMPRKQKNVSVSLSDDIQATTLPQNTQTHLKTQNSAVSVDLVKNPMQSAINAKNKRKTKQKKR